MIACLGRANWWFTIPLFSVIGILAMVAIASPPTFRRLPGRHYSDGWTRVLGLVLLAVALVLVALAVDEARIDPDCRLDAAPSAQAKGWLP